MHIPFDNIQALSEYIQQFGTMAPLLMFLLFVIQAALPVFPYIILATAGGMLFGFKLGVLLSWAGALAGACIAYWFFRLLGYDWMTNTLYRRFNYKMPDFSPSRAFWTIIITRIIPVIPTPLINLAAAMGGVSFWTFFTSSAIGKIPSAILYTGLGLALFNASDVKTALTLLGIFLTLLLVIQYYAKKYYQLHS